MRPPKHPRGGGGCGGCESPPRRRVATVMATPRTRRIGELEDLVGELTSRVESLVAAMALKADRRLTMMERLVSSAPVPRQMMLDWMDGCVFSALSATRLSTSKPFEIVATEMIAYVRASAHAPPVRAIMSGRMRILFWFQADVDVQPDSCPASAQREEQEQEQEQEEQHEEEQHEEKQQHDGATPMRPCRLNYADAWTPRVTTPQVRRASAAAAPDGIAAGVHRGNWVKLCPALWEKLMQTMYELYLEAASRVVLSAEQNIAYGRIKLKSMCQSQKSKARIVFFDALLAEQERWDAATAGSPR